MEIIGIICLFTLVIFFPVISHMIGYALRRVTEYDKNQHSETSSERYVRRYNNRKNTIGYKTGTSIGKMWNWLQEEI